MRTYHLTSSLVSLCLLLGSCTLGSIDPDTIDIAEADDEIGDVDDADETGTQGGDGDGDTGETGDTGVSESSTGESTTEDTGDTTDDETDTADASDTSSTDNASDTTGSDACMGVAVEGECTTCLVDNCCDQVLACLDDEVCACYYACDFDSQNCGDQCGAPTEAVVNLGQCADLSDCQQCL